jgi:hypothetical protein
VIPPSFEEKIPAPQKSPEDLIEGISISSLKTTSRYLLKLQLPTPTATQLFDPVTGKCIARIAKGSVVSVPTEKKYILSRWDERMKKYVAYIAVDSIV